MSTLTGLRARVAERVPEPLFYRLVSWLHYAGERELRMLRTFVPPDQVALDVGAWYGPWAYWLARIARRVEAFEPVPDVAQFLRRVVPSNVAVWCVALSDRSGEGELFVPTGGRGTEGVSSLVAPAAGGPERKRIQVPLGRLDDFAFTSVGFVKIDVEGHELQVLAGARKTISEQMPTVLVEIEQRFHREPISDVFEAVTSLGYEGSFLYGDHWLPLSAFDLDRHQREPFERLHDRGFVGHSLLGDKGYVNNFLFTVAGGSRPAPPLAL
jgi:FkbM family methyltransferase